jgi:hypothetical protein
MQSTVRQYATGKLHIRATQGAIVEVWFEANDPSKVSGISEGSTFTCLATKSQGGDYYYVLGVVESVTPERVVLAPRFTFFRPVSVGIDERGIKVTQPKSEEMRTFSANQDVVLYALTPVSI